MSGLGDLHWVPSGSVASCVARADGSRYFCILINSSDMRGLTSGCVSVYPLGSAFRDVMLDEDSNYLCQHVPRKTRVCLHCVRLAAQQKRGAKQCTRTPCL